MDHIPPSHELKLRARFLHYIARERAARRPILLSDRHVNELAAIAYRALPVPRDVEVTHRRPVEVADTAVEVGEVERLVLELLPLELSPEVIGERLGLTKGQVQRAQKALHRVLGSQTRHRAVAVAVERGVLRLEDGAWRAVRLPEAVLGAGVGDSLSGDPEGLQGASEAFEGAA